MANNINWRFPLSKGKNGYFEFNETVPDAIKEDIQNVLFTQKGSRIIVRDYGSNIVSYLMEPKNANLKSKINHEIIDAITKWVRGVKVSNVDILFDEDITPSSQYFGRVSLGDSEVLIIIYYEITSADGNFMIPNQKISFKMNGQ